MIETKDLLAHPKLVGHYVDGRVQVVPLKGKGEKEILSLCNRLRERTGKPLTMRKWALPQTTKKSYQGMWKADTWTQFPFNSQVVAAAAAAAPAAPSQ